MWTYERTMEVDQYRVLMGEGASKLEAVVNEAIGNGWVPVGGIAVLSGNQGDAPLFMQAVVLLK